MVKPKRLTGFLSDTARPKRSWLLLPPAAVVGACSTGHPLPAVTRTPITAVAATTSEQPSTTATTTVAGPPYRVSEVTLPLVDTGRQA